MRNVQILYTYLTFRGSLVYRNTYVFVFEEAEHLELSEDPFRRDERLENVGKLFEGHAPTIARVCHRPVDKQTKKLYLRSAM